MLPTKDGAVVRTIGEAANYVLALPKEHAEGCNRWQHAARLLLAQADAHRELSSDLAYDA